MATSIPSSMSFEMLSRLPANSFVQTWKEIRPDQSPSEGYYDFAQPHNIRFVLRGAPNEFALNTNMYVCGEADMTIKAQTTSAALTPDQVNLLGSSCYSYLKQPVDYFKSSRESFNAGALPYLDNQDNTRSHVINNLRYSLARRNVKVGGGRSEDDLRSARDDVYAYENSDQFDFENTGSSNGLVVQYRTSTSSNIYNGGSKAFQIPLGTYSNFVNSHSVIPLGLLSSYAVNGWQIELVTQEQSPTQNEGDGFVYKFDKSRLVEGTGGDIPVALTATDVLATMSNLRIYVPIVRVLDPSVMSAVLSLYEKQEQVAVGGVQFPLSLRINSMAYRFANFPLSAKQQDYFFRIAGTDRSVRAVAWWIYNTDNVKAGDYAVDKSSTGNEFGAIRCTRIETNIGSEHIHDPVEDNSAQSSNVKNFISMNVKRSASLFSPLPYYQEGRKFDGQQDDDLLKYNNGTSAQTSSKDGSTTDFFKKRAIAYGLVSMENLDRREGEYSGSFQASGKDLTNVGAIEMRMRFQQYRQANATLAADGTITDITKVRSAPSDQVTEIQAGYEIVFAYAYDSVMEVSPSGVMDVTNAVL